MAVSDLRQEVIKIVNRVQPKLGIDATTTLTANKTATALLDMLNEIMDECSDYGDWQEAYFETIVTAQSSVNEYEVRASGATLVKNVLEIHWDDEVAPLNVQDISFLRLRGRKPSYGTPRHFAIVGVNASSGNPTFRVDPVPTTSATFNIAAYEKPRILTTSDVSAVPFFPAEVLFKGLYAKALLAENGGEPTREYLVANEEYSKARREACNRFNADTGVDIFIQPG